MYPRWMWLKNIPDDSTAFGFEGCKNWVHADCIIPKKVVNDINKGKKIYEMCRSSVNVLKEMKEEIKKKNKKNANWKH